jgi:hypothetical protein
MRRSSLAAAAALAVSGLLAGGCAHSTTAPTDSSAESSISPAVATYSRGIPPGVTEPARTSHGVPDPFVAWAGGRQLYVITFGSSSCPSLPSLVESSGAHHLNIKLASNLAPGSTASCTADEVATTSTVDLPEAIDVSSPIAVDIDGGRTSLQPR